MVVSFSGAVEGKRRRTAPWVQMTAQSHQTFDSLEAANGLRPAGQEALSFLILFVEK